MLYREVTSGQFSPWDYGPIDGIRHPPNIEQLWTAQELAANDLYAPVRLDVPEGKRVVAETVQRVNGVVQFVCELEDIPALTRIPKDLIWRRATDEEAAAMDAALKQQPIRIRRIYDGVQLIDKGGELYGALSTAMVALFGADRAAELLEPTE